MIGGRSHISIKSGNSPLDTVFSALGALFLVIAIGTTGFMITEEQWGFWKSLYFCLITITTVGYGDYGLSPAGERFATVVLLIGIGTATFCFGQITRALIAYQFDWRRRMQNKINQISNHYIICSSGPLGEEVWKHLLQTTARVVVIEQDAERVENLTDEGMLVVHGNPTEDEALIAAGIERACGLTTVSENDPVNIVVTLSARELNPKITIVACAHDSTSIAKLRRAGADHVIAPDVHGGRDIAQTLVEPDLAAFMANACDDEGGYRVVAVRIDNDSSMVGQSLRQYGEKRPDFVLVALRLPDGSMRLRPRADTHFSVDDVLIIAADVETVSHIRADASATKRRAA